MRIGDCGLGIGKRRSLTQRREGANGRRDGTMKGMKSVKERRDDHEGTKRGMRRRI